MARTRVSAATASIVGAQILVETMTNELRVGGINASSRMDAAILAIRPETTVLTGDPNRNRQTNCPGRHLL